MNKICSSCIKRVGESLKCPSCAGFSIKYGLSSAGKQRYYCRNCQKTFIHFYTRLSYRPKTDQKISTLIKEGSGISSISRYLRISKVTVSRRILKIAGQISRPFLAPNLTFEVDELWTFIKTKNYPAWIIYALCRESRSVVNFVVGNRSNVNIGNLINPLLLSRPIKIYTDKFQSYKVLVPVNIYSTHFRGTNHIERKNLSLRTHLKRLTRRTICFSKSKDMLEACLKIYFWG